MADVTDNDLLDYEEEDQAEAGTEAANGTNGTAAKKDVKGTYVSIHSSGFRDFLLKPEILRAIVDCGFEHPSEGKYLIDQILLILPIPLFSHCYKQTYVSQIIILLNIAHRYAITLAQVRPSSIFSSNSNSLCY